MQFIFLVQLLFFQNCLFNSGAQVGKRLVFMFRYYLKCFFREFGTLIRDLFNGFL